MTAFLSSSIFFISPAILEAMPLLSRLEYSSQVYRFALLQIDRNCYYQMPLNFRTDWSFSTRIAQRLHIVFIIWRMSFWFFRRYSNYPNLELKSICLLIYNSTHSLVDMDLTIDQQVIRTYSHHLRFLQLALQTLLCQLISKIDSQNCSATISSVGQPVSIILLLFNIAGLAIIRCTRKFNRKMFLGAFGVNLLFAGVLMLVGLLGIGESNSCANNRILHRFVGFQALLAIILGLLTFCGKYDFALRYTNAPGNLAWVFLFFSFDWSTHFKTFYIPAGVINLIITIANLSANLVFMMSNFNVNIKRVVFLVWFGSLIAMAIAEIMVFLGYVAGGADANSIVDSVAKKLGQVFLIVNIFDALFWLYGMLGLRIQIGESIHEEAFGIKERDQRTDIC